MLDEPGAVAIFAAHPDDETIGASTQLFRLAPHMSVIHVTDGAPRNMRDAAAYGFSSARDYAAARREELHAALELAGIKPHQIEQIGVPDQEASFDLAGLARWIENYLEANPQAIVLTHAYEGGHPDHDACSFAVHAAVALLEKRCFEHVPRVVEFAAYRASPHGGMAAFEFLPRNGCTVFTVELDETQRDLKRRMIDCFRSQRQTLSQFPIAIERFRPAPHYDYTKPPHPGKLHYDTFEWGVKSPEWVRLAAGALETLGPGVLI